jgi:NADPH-dependent 2,4-dienoyl-CoA reductase/sulfur reductase-like enzyme
MGDRRITCDYLACGFGLVPNLELPMALGCRVAGSVVWTDARQQTSIAGVYCAGEATGIGGLDASLVEGQIAGLAATGQGGEVRTLFRLRRRTRRFTRTLAHSFALRNELRSLPDADTVICRCEDVTFADLGQADNWRDAKLQTRIGMGPCQGRVCGAAMAFLCGWTPDSVRPPLSPVPLDHLVEPIAEEAT